MKAPVAKSSLRDAAVVLDGMVGGALDGVAGLVCAGAMSGTSGHCASPSGAVGHSVSLARTFGHSAASSAVAVAMPANAASETSESRAGIRVTVASVVNAETLNQIVFDSLRGVQRPVVMMMRW